MSAGPVLRNLGTVQKIDQNHPKSIDLAGLIQNDEKKWFSWKVKHFFALTTQLSWNASCLEELSASWLPNHTDYPPVDQAVGRNLQN